MNTPSQEAKALAEQILQFLFGSEGSVEGDLERIAKIVDDALAVEYMRGAREEREGWWD